MPALIVVVFYSVMARNPIFLLFRRQGLQPLRKRLNKLVFSP